MSNKQKEPKLEQGPMGEVIPPEGCIVMAEDAFVFTPLYFEFISEGIYSNAIRAFYGFTGKEPFDTTNHQVAMEAHEFAMRMVVEQVTKDTTRSLMASLGDDMTVLSGKFPMNLFTDSDKPDA